MSVERGRPTLIQRFFGLILIVSGLLMSLLGGFCTLVGLQSLRASSDMRGLAEFSLAVGLPVLLVGTASVGVGVWLLFVGPRKRPGDPP
ncbi:MAG TPA: hypothetical protein VFN88_02460 [Caulobacteraceae bacterium]|nr:hypothetical protein [Caulobacteraceae bacterium]